MFSISDKTENGFDKIILKDDQFAKLKEMEAAMRNRGNGQRAPGQ